MQCSLKVLIRCRCHSIQAPKDQRSSYCLCCTVMQMQVWQQAVAMPQESMPLPTTAMAATTHQRQCLSPLQEGVTGSILAVKRYMGPSMVVMMPLTMAMTSGREDRRLTLLHLTDGGDSKTYTLLRSVIEQCVASLSVTTVRVVCIRTVSTWARKQLQVLQRQSEHNYSACCVSFVHVWNCV